MWQSVKIYIADQVYAIACPRGAAMWAIRFTVTTVFLSIAAWSLAILFNKDIMAWIADGWPHYKVDWGNGQWARFPRWSSLLVLGFYFPFVLFPLLMSAMLPYCLNRRGRAFGSDVTASSVLALWGMLLATSLGWKNLYWDASPYLLLPMCVGTVVSIAQLRHVAHSYWDTIACGVTAVIPIAFYWHCMSLPHVAGNAH